MLAATDGSVEELDEPLETVPLLEALLPLPLDPESVPEGAAAEEEEEAAMLEDGGWELPDMYV